MDDYPVMNNIQELIERLKAEELNRSDTLLTETITAMESMQAPLPEDVGALLDEWETEKENYQQPGDLNIRMRNMLERLARENAELYEKINEGNEGLLCYIDDLKQRIEELEVDRKHYMQECVKADKRIEELEDKAASFEGSFNAALKDVQRLEATLAEIEAEARRIREIKAREGK